MSLTCVHSVLHFRIHDDYDETDLKGVSIEYLSLGVEAIS